MKFDIIICVTFLLTFFNLKGSAQNISTADSLIKTININYDQSESAKRKALEDILKLHNNADTVLKYADFLIDLSNKHKEYEFKGNYHKGIAFKQKGFFEKSLESFYLSEKIAQQINCNSCRIAANIAIGDVFSESYNSSDAILYYNKALEFARLENDSIFLASTLLKAGSEYVELKQFESALKYLTKARKLFKSSGNEFGYAYALGKIGKIYAEKRVFHIAEKNISDALSILEKYQDNKALSIYYRYLSEIYRDKKNLESSLEYAHISLSIASHSKLLPEIRDAYKLLTELYAIKGDLDNAFECQSNYINTRDKINKEETIRKMADLRTDYEVAQKQAEVDLLNKQRQTQRLLVIGLFIVLLLTSGIFIVHYTNSRKRKFLHKKLILRKEELQKQRDQLEKVNKTKDRFFSIISHDLRGPINVLNGTTLLIRDFLNSKSYEELDELTINMEYSVKKVQNLLDNLLEWAVSQQGEFPYKPEKLDMDDICDTVLNIFITMAATKSIKLTYEIKPDSKYIIADKNSLMTIMRNLVSNAIKFTHKEGAVNILAEKKNGNYMVSVSDSGVGMSEDKQRDLFQISEDKSTWGTAKEKGLGIGLSLVYEFVKMNKGEISVDSIINAGTSIRFNIPQEIKPNNFEINQKKPKQIKLRRIRTGKRQNYN